MSTIRIISIARVALVLILLLLVCVSTLRDVEVTAVVFPKFKFKSTITNNRLQKMITSSTRTLVVSSCVFGASIALTSQQPALGDSRNGITAMSTTVDTSNSNGEVTAKDLLQQQLWSTIAFGVLGVGLLINDKSERRIESKEMKEMMTLEKKERIEQMALEKAERIEQMALEKAERLEDNKIMDNKYNLITFLTFVALIVSITKLFL